MKKIKIIKPVPRVFNFSMGETSAFMTLEYAKEGDHVLCCDTTREILQSYEFLNEFERREGIKVHRLILPDGWDGFLEKWNHGKSLPNRGMRECTLRLKIQVARRWCRANIGMKYENFIGFRKDEKHRVDGHTEKWQQVKTRFPLYEDGITKAMINEYWQNKPYRLMIPKILGNCDLCFMKGANAIISILTNFPEKADRWIADEEDPRNIHKHTYVKGISMRMMKEAALELASKGKIYNLDEVMPQLNCACTA